MSEDYPMYLYEYGADGMHSGRQYINNDTELRAMMASVVTQAMREGREIRITDTGDHLIFHAEHGRVVWPTPEQMAGVR